MTAVCWDVNELIAVGNRPKDTVLSIWYGTVYCLTHVAFIRILTFTRTCIGVKGSAIPTFLTVTLRITYATHDRAHVTLHVVEAITVLARDIPTHGGACVDVNSISSVGLAFS